MGKRIGFALLFPMKEPIQPQWPPVPLGDRMNVEINVLFQKTASLIRQNVRNAVWVRKKRYSTDADVKIFPIIFTVCRLKRERAPKKAVSTAFSKKRRHLQPDGQEVHQHMKEGLHESRTTFHFS